MRIALLATGGTIACRQTPDGLSPALHAEELAKSISCRDDVTLLPVDVFSMDSSNIQPEEWTQLAHAVDRAMQTCDGVVITHGTDTMGYTAAALSYMLLGQTKPVILTGQPIAPWRAPLRCRNQPLLRYRSRLSGRRRDIRLLQPQADSWHARRQNAHALLRCL